jgi:hypothetical protein
MQPPLQAWGRGTVLRSGSLHLHSLTTAFTEGTDRAFARPIAGSNRGKFSSQNTKQQKERTAMDNKFDELAKGLAQSVTRRQAFKKFGIGIAGMALACFGLANRAEAKTCSSDTDCNHVNEKWYRCCGGVCTTLLDNQNCGFCGVVCPKGTKCTYNSVPGYQCL